MGEGVANVSCIWDRSSESVEFWDHEGVTGAYCGEGLVEAGALAFGAADAVVDVDAIRRNAESEERLALSGEVLLIRGASCVSDLSVG